MSRHGKVFCVRLTQLEREQLVKATAAENARRLEAREGGWYWQPITLGEFVRAAALRRADELLAPPAPAARKRRTRRPAP